MQYEDKLINNKIIYQLITNMALLVPQWAYFFSYSKGDCRTYSYVVALSSDEKVDYEDLMTLAKLIPRICHNVNRYNNLMFVS